MSSEIVAILLLGLAGFLLGGVYANWKKARGLAIALLVCAVLAAGGAVAWLTS
ncbi:hypothetical protein [Actinophytocola sp.]|uniref:hypothetical protein n=1 Tax=Actinophytocola sp. TaxID=1872138 RepID=UPI002D7FD878|nr:hypothetical protein [Actinophytocola sp.]HET9138936.1 hypothetical protein [Actinophytocola sp.]HEU5108543.1 hypothetical protein [Micromonosporaceae bacterium]